MNTVKITATINKSILLKLDRLVKDKFFKNRSSAIQKAIEDEFKLLEKQKFIEACEKLNPKEEQSVAEEGMEFDKWPAY